jgi:hypothetical protein
VIAHVSTFLSFNDIANVSCLAQCFRYGVLFADILIYPPWPPLRSRLFGGHKRSPLRCAHHDCPSPFLIFHHSWEFLDPLDRYHLSAAFPIMRDYAKLCLSAASTSLATLRDDCPPVDGSAIDKQRGWLMGVALLRFDFLYGNLVRWLGGEYTNAFHDWEEAFKIVDSVRHHPVPPGYPPLDFDRAYRTCTKGVPLAGIFECSMSSTW